MKKKIGIYIFIIGLLLVVLGVVFHFFSNTTSPNNMTSDRDEFDKAHNITRNDNLTDEHCNSTICINDLMLANEDDMFKSLIGTITLKGENDISDYYFTLSFSGSSKTFRIPIYLDALKKGEAFYLQWIYEDDEILKSSDYSIVESTNEEITQLQSEFVD